MSNKKFKKLVFIGRFAPFHVGHQQVLETALSLADEVLILVGSSFRPNTIKNPWSYNDRHSMIRDVVLQLNAVDRVDIKPLRDFIYNDDTWVAQVQGLVPETSGVGIIGHDKDDSSFYLDLFPQWEQVIHPMNEAVHATDIRNILFEGKNPRYIKDLLPSVIYERMLKYVTTGSYKDRVNEYNFIQKYKKAWAGAPYEPVFLTADAVVVQSGHILMVTRGANPGKGLLALPGGFVNSNETLRAAALRELIEETKIDVPLKVLNGSISQHYVFDHPTRSLRGRTVTEAFFIELPPGKLPKVKGSDDAIKAQWIPFNQLDSEMIFEDHWDIITRFVNFSWEY